MISCVKEWKELTLYVSLSAGQGQPIRRVKRIEIGMKLGAPIDRVSDNDIIDSYTIGLDSINRPTEASTQLSGRLWQMNYVIYNISAFQ